VSDVISFIVAQVHDTKGLVCRINIQSTLLSYANLATNNIDHGRCDEWFSPCVSYRDWQECLHFLSFHGTQSRLGLSKTGHQESGEKTEGNTHPKA